MSAARRVPWLDVAVLAAGCLIAWLTFFQPFVFGIEDVPGDLADARFNLYVLEHVFRWMSGLESSLLSPAIFWPYPYALAFSDTHAGTAWVYSLFRAVGLDSYDAFKVWFALGYLTSFFAAYHVCRKLAFTPLLAGALSLAFAFSLPAMVQMGHAQLAWRIAVPYCFWFTLRYAEKGAPADLFRLLTAVAVQTLINVYLGMFALILCGLLFIGNFVARDGLSLRGWRRRAGIMLLALRNLDRRAWPSAAVAAVAVAALFLLLGFHGYVASLYGIERPWAEISSMLPRLQSYLLSDRLPYWAPLSHALPDVPARGEQQIFLGVPLTLLAIVALVYVLFTWRSTTPRLRALTFCILSALVLFTSIDGVSLYWVIAQLPGFNSIRAVSRVMLVLAFPIVLLIGFALREFSAREKLPWLVPATAIVVAAWMTLDIATIGKIMYSSAKSQARVEALLSSAPDDDGPIVFGIGASEIWVVHALDQMLATQQSGRPLLHGYSGYMPPGFTFVPSCAAAQAMLKHYERLAKRRDLPKLTALGETPVAIDMGPCDLSPATLDAVRVSSGRSLRREDAPLITLDELRLTQGRVLVASVRVTNGSGKTIHGVSRHPFRLSWRIGDDPDWTQRVNIASDIRPGRSQILSWPVPDATRLEDLSVTFVVEGDFWGHDAGFTPLSGAGAE